jgi:hypothetical protein
MKHKCIKRREHDDQQEGEADCDDSNRNRHGHTLSDRCIQIDGVKGNRRSKKRSQQGGQQPQVFGPVNERSKAHDNQTGTTQNPNADRADHRVALVIQKHAHCTQDKIDLIRTWLEMRFSVSFTKRNKNVYQQNGQVAEHICAGAKIIR